MLNDIALVYLSEDIEFNEEIQPAKIPSKDYILKKGTIVTAIGWGKLNVSIALYLLT